MQLEKELLANITFQYVLGGLAADSAEPMSETMQHYLQQTWKNIQQKIPGTSFNFDFWSQCQPRRSTYPACRAVIAAARQNPAAEKPMILAIQQAYYLKALNPADNSTLIMLAAELGLDPIRFERDLKGDGTARELNQQIQLARKLGTDSFPSLVLNTSHQLHQIPIDYNNAHSMRQQIISLINYDEEC